jgi:hypothetical protein
MAGMTALSVASYALMAGSAAMAAYSYYKGGKAQERAYNAQAEQDESNARQKALETSINEDTARKQQRGNLARMSAAQSEAGLEGGTATTAYMDSVRNSEQDVMNLRYQGMSQWANYKNQAALNRFYGKQAFKQGQLGAWTSGIGGLSQIGSMYASSYTPKFNEPKTTGNTLTGGYAQGGTNSLGGYSYMGKNPYMFY